MQQRERLSPPSSTVSPGQEVILAKPTAAKAPVAAPAEPQSSTSSRLSELSALLHEKLISQAEFEATRKKIIDST